MIRGYDQWKTASPYDEDETLVDLDSLLRCDKVLRNYGKPGHGLYGKDSDLESCGQVYLKQISIVDPIKSKHLRIDIDLHYYCSICAPCEYSAEKWFTKLSPDQKQAWMLHSVEEAHEFLMDQAAGIVFDMHSDAFGDPFALMWDGDYWSGGFDATISVPLFCNEYEALDDPYTANETLDVIESRIAHAIYDADQGGDPVRNRIKLYANKLALANKRIDGLTDIGAN